MTHPSLQRAAAGSRRRWATTFVACTALVLLAGAAWAGDARAGATAPAANLPPAVSEGARGGGQEGERYRIVCHFECGARIGEEALRIAEAAWPFAAEVFGGTPTTGAARMEIHLYRTVADYRRARSGFLRPAPRHLAITDPSSRTAHIALPDAIADTTLRRFGLPLNMLRVVAHEAFHLAAIAHAPRSVLLPVWLKEGAASWAEHEALRAAGVAAEPEHEPVASTYLWLLQRRAQTGTLPSVAQVLRDELPGFDDQEHYAVRKLLFEQVLAQPRGLPLPAIIDDVLASAGRFARAGRIADLLHERLFGDDAPPGPLQLDLHGAAAAAAPRWAQAGRSLDPVPDSAWLQIGLSGDAEAWRLRFAGITNLSGRVEPLTTGASRLLIGTNEEGSIVVTFDFDADELLIHRARGRADTEPLARAELRRPDHAPLAFEISAAPGRLTAVAGAARIELQLDDVTPNGRWAVGVSAGMNAVWHGLP